MIELYFPTLIGTQKRTLFDIIKGLTSLQTLDFSGADNPIRTDDLLITNE